MQEEKKSIEAATSMAEAARASGSNDKIIVYCQFVQRANEVARQLGCGVYHSKAGSRAARAEVVRRWKAEGGIVVATSALGAGIDVPDVRAVVHIGMPRSLRDFVQESGRAGRDGKPSLSRIFVSERNAVDRPEAGAAAGAPTTGRVAPEKEDIQQFVRGVEPCRRITLDRVMDGRVDREGFEDGEEACDLCKDDQEDGTETPLPWMSPPAYSDGEPASSPVALAGTDDGVAEAQLQRMDWGVREQAGRERGGGRAADRFVRSLGFWSRNCVVCLVTGAWDGYVPHPFCYGKHASSWERGAPKDAWMQAQSEGLRAMGVFQMGAKPPGVARGTEAGAVPYSGCYHCGLPQKVCARWVAIDGEGASFKQANRGCDRFGVLSRCLGFASANHLLTDAVRAEALGIVRGCGVWLEDDASLDDILRVRVKWAGFEANGLCVLFSLLDRDREDGAQQFLDSAARRAYRI